jgi:hypothetical protein
MNEPRKLCCREEGTRKAAARWPLTEDERTATSGVGPTAPD